jgi:hypothetical protein
MAGAFHERLSASYGESVTRLLSTGFAGTLGLSVDRELTNGFGIRISANLASSGWRQRTAENSDSPGERYDDAGFYAAVGLKPAVELRMTF